MPYAAGWFRGRLQIVTDVTSTRNRLLAQLPRGVQDRLAAHVRMVPLRVGELLFTARTPACAAYFPESGLVSLVTTVRSGEAMDVGLVGRDGVAGAQMAADGIDDVPFDGVVRVRGDAARVEMAPLRAQISSDPVLARMLGRHAHLTCTGCVTSAACIAFHPAHRRCARWLLEASDLLAGAELALTHDQLAHMMGVRRESVTVALGSLDARGLIAHGRAHIVVRDREGLEAAACECYEVMRAERRRLLGD
jgi:CRP-like cAMP-binding protein